VKRALLQEFGRPLPEGPDLARLIKALPVHHKGPRPMDEAISTAGGVTRAAVDDGLMLRALPGVFVAGEMLDWEAPTGGYLITGCLATGSGPGATRRNGSGL
jgi:predicted flavoprotein YhiN